MIKFHALRPGETQAQRKQEAELRAGWWALLGAYGLLLAVAVTAPRIGWAERVWLYNSAMALFAALLISWRLLGDWFVLRSCGQTRLGFVQWLKYKLSGDDIDE